MFLEEIERLKSLRLRDAISKACFISLFMTSAMVVWNIFSAITQCNVSIVVVLSGSMEPGYHRGDILFLHHLPAYPPVEGDIVVFSVPKVKIPIVHRVNRVHDRKVDGHRFLLTKGDNNLGDDRGIYPFHMDWVEDSMIHGKSFAFIPVGGYMTILFSASIAFKVVGLGLMLLLVFASNE